MSRYNSPCLRFDLSLIFNMTDTRIFPMVIALSCALFFGPRALSDPKSFNGTWLLHAQESQSFKDAGKEKNEDLLRMRREKHRQEFNRDSGTPSGPRGMVAHANAANKMIREDERPPPWEVVDEIEAMIEAESIKLYYARKIAILYGDARKRLLKVNPAGRSFSISGTKITNDEIGTSLTYMEDGTIVIETDTRWRDKLVERFALNDTSEQMLVTIRLQQVGTGPWLEYTRVFDRQN